VPRTLALLLALALAACGAKKADLTEEDVRDLVPAAASIPKKMLNEIAEAGASVSPKTMSTLPLSLLLMSVSFEKDTEDLHRLHVPGVNLKIWVNAPRSSVTTFPEDCLSDVVCETAPGGDRASGSFLFSRPGLVGGRVEFEAEWTEDGWRMVEFRLPAVNAKTRLDGEGNWKAFEEE